MGHAGGLITLAAEPGSHNVTVPESASRCGDQDEGHGPHLLDRETGLTPWCSCCRPRPFTDKPVSSVFPGNDGPTVPCSTSRSRLQWEEIHVCLIHTLAAPLS